MLAKKDLLFQNYMYVGELCWWKFFCMLVKSMFLKKFLISPTYRFFANILFHQHYFHQHHAIQEVNVGGSFSPTYMFFTNMHFSPSCMNHAAWFKGRNRCAWLTVSQSDHNIFFSSLMIILWSNCFLIYIRITSTCSIFHVIEQMWRRFLLIMTYRMSLS